MTPVDAAQIALLRAYLVRVLARLAGELEGDPGSAGGQPRTESEEGGGDP
jgi:hypothetical protein